MDSSNTNNCKNNSPASKKLKSDNTPSPIMCTFQDGDTHPIQLDPSNVAWIEVSVDDVRKILAARTVHQAEAIQLFSTDGDGRELSDDSEIVPAGSQLQVIVRDLQYELKSKLREALARNDHAGCWCWAVVCKELAMETSHGTTGDLLKLVQVNNNYYAFLTRSLDTIETPDLECRGNQIYLLHEDQFLLKWVKKGISFNELEQGREWDGEGHLKFLRIRASDVRMLAE